MSNFQTKYLGPHSGNGPNSPPVARKPAGFTKRGREFAQRLVESDTYRAWIQERITAKTLDPSIERMLWAYAYGKPKETIEVNDRRLELSEASHDVLAARATKLATLLSQLNSITDKTEAERLIRALHDADSEVPAVH